MLRSKILVLVSYNSLELIMVRQEAGKQLGQLKTVQMLWYTVQAIDISEQDLFGGHASCFRSLLAMSATLRVVVNKGWARIL